MRLPLRHQSSPHRYHVPMGQFHSVPRCNWALYPHQNLGPYHTNVALCMGLPEYPIHLVRMLESIRQQLKG